MKFFAAFFATITFLLGANSYGIPTKLHTHELIPSKIVDTKKMDPIKVPHIDCIVNIEGEAHTLEEHTKVCLIKRRWLKINIEQEKTSFWHW